MLNDTQKRADVAVLLSGNIKKFIRDKEGGHYILMIY